MATTAAYGPVRGNNCLWLGEGYLLTEKARDEFFFYISHAKTHGENAVVCDLATCGARIPMALAKAGVKRIYAIDASESVLTEVPKALERNLTPEEQTRIILMKGDMRWFTLPESVDLVTIAFYSFWYNFGIHPRRPPGSIEKTGPLALREAILCLRSIVKALRPGGKFIIHAALSMEFEHFGDDVKKRINWWRTTGARLGFSFYLYRDYASFNQSEDTRILDFQYGSVLVGQKL